MMSIADAIVAVGYYSSATGMLLMHALHLYMADSSLLVSDWRYLDNACLVAIIIMIESAVWSSDCHHLRTGFQHKAPADFVTEG